MEKRFLQEKKMNENLSQLETSGSEMKMIKLEINEVIKRTFFKKIYNQITHFSSSVSFPIFLLKASTGTPSHIFILLLLKLNFLQ